MNKEKDKQNLINKMNTEHTYASTDDPGLQGKTYVKREFYYNKVPVRPEIDPTNYPMIKEYVDNKCAGTSVLHPHQAMLANFINPNTPYKGLLLFHGLGSGKTCAAISIAENFKEQVKKYNTKIHVLVPGPNTKANYKSELIKPQCTGETYQKMVDKDALIDKDELELNKKQAIGQALQYYKIMTFKGFYKRVLGERIKDKTQVTGDKIKGIYKKTDEGEFERDIVIDKITNLNNTLLIVDEAHGLTSNNYGEALKEIIKNSLNLRVILMSATPMKNLADDIIELLNYLRPLNSQILREKIFTSDKIHNLQLKDNGIQYLKNMAQGYISHIRGADPLTFAKRVDKGVIPPGMSFTKVTQCKMSKLQRKVYDKVIEDIDDSLNSKSSSVSNFVFPSLNSNNEIEGVYGRVGINNLKNQLISKSDILNKKIQNLFKNNEQDYLYLNETGKITGNIFKMKYLKYFSCKYYKALKKLNRLVWGKKGPKTAFIYAHLVVTGIELFQQVLVQNGYVEYNETGVYNIKPDSVCYYCGEKYENHYNNHNRQISREQSDSDSDTDVETVTETKEKKLKDNESVSELRSPSSTDYKPYKQFQTVIPKHEFKPSTFLTVTGGAGEDEQENIPEEKQEIIKKIFNSIENKEGKLIKFIIGSKVMNEGISLFNVGEVHILNVYYNLGKVDQTVGRAIRYCSHHKLMTPDNIFPFVNVYKYVVTLNDTDKSKLSSEEELYQKAENKYILIKYIERALKEVAIDCPLNASGNMFIEEINKHKHCNNKFDNIIKDKNKDDNGKDNTQEVCPVECDFTKCNYKCDDKVLNNKYYDPKRYIYKIIPKDKIDGTTFINALARNEIRQIKDRIKELYIVKHVYTLQDIVKYVKESYEGEKQDMFDEFFVYKGLDELIPTSSNDINNFKDTIIDKFNRKGYLIYINKYYIFQPYNQNEDIPMFYRTTFDTKISNQLSLYNFIKDTPKYKEFRNNQNIVSDISGTGTESEKEVSFYDYESVLPYYDAREEFKYVGVIDKELNRGKSKDFNEHKDVFKIREKRRKHSDKKREVGIPTIMGSVCATSKDKEYLLKIAKELNITVNKNTRFNICQEIKEKMLLLEKHSDNITYIIIPKNHPEYVFPYNLKDRVKYITEEIEKISSEIKIKTNKSKYTYEMVISNDPLLEKYDDFLKRYGAIKKADKYVINLK